MDMLRTKVYVVMYESWDSSTCIERIFQTKSSAVHYIANERPQFKLIRTEFSSLRTQFVPLRWKHEITSKQTEYLILKERELF